ncbi:MAG: CBS domain-containing protein [Desulfocapsaceae bacterium]|nr:CBS domain-containing protein [Desulfocapsaceae bacterium]
MKVIDVMETLSYWLTPEMTLHEAITIMHRAKRGHGLSVNAIVVLDSEKKLAGIVSTTDILRAIIPSEMFFEEDHSRISWEGLRQTSIAKTKNLHVRDVMTEDVRIIRTNDSILRCADRLLAEQIRRLPVVALDGKVVGVVYLRDVYNAITELLCETEALNP